MDRGVVIVIWNARVCTKLRQKGNLPNVESFHSMMKRSAPVFVQLRIEKSKTAIIKRYLFSKLGILPTFL